MQNIQGAALKSGDGPDLTLAPNPAMGQTAVLYRYASDSKEADRSIELYDVIGRKLKSYKVTERDGSFIIPLGQFTSGIYLVVMKANGKIIRQSKLSIAK